MTDFQNASFLRQHIRSILDFYLPNIVDKTGGFHHNFKDDGSLFNPGQRHLVSSCRMVFIFCKAHQLFGEEKYKALAEHGVAYIRQYHWDPVREGYHWTLKDGHQPDDQTNHCYGLAFVVLAFAAAFEINIAEAKNDMEQAYSIMEKRLWDTDVSLYADEATPDWSKVDEYRGQNANMHACEAMIAAYEVTKEDKYLDRAYGLAKTVTIDLTTQSDGLVWEHFKKSPEHKELLIDWSYNKNDPKNLYRPWGFQPGHQTEWSKLLVTLFNLKPESWMIDKAKFLFDQAMDVSWDMVNGGIFYGFSPDRAICDNDKYFWVQAETFAAAARLQSITGQSTYMSWYKTIWQYSWDHMIDHKYGAWFRVLTVNNGKYTDEKSTAGGKCDYHTIGACWDVLRSLHPETI